MMSVTSEFYAWMDLNWPIVLLSIFIVVVFLVGMFVLMIWMLRRDSERTIGMLLSLSDEQERRATRMLSDLTGKMTDNKEAIMGTVSDAAEALVEEVDERQAERTSFLTGDHDG